MSQAGTGIVEQAKRAAASGDWGRAHELFTEADAAGEVGAEELPLVAEVAYAAGHLDGAIEAWERAHALALRAQDHISAAGAAVRVAMHLLFDTALMAPVRGWLSRAERLLGDAGPTPVHAWLGVVRSYERLLSGDVEAASRAAREAVELGSRFDPAAASIGRVASARCLILSGDVGDGLAALDEAGVAVLSGELDALSTGVVYCELVCALQGLAQFDLAEQWTRAMERWAQTSAIGSLRGRCRVHRAEILRLRGHCEEAEEEALRACEELRPYLRRELGWPLAELGRIRLHLGAVEDAEEAFVAAHETGWDARHGLAMVHLARGEVETAAQSIRSALERPSSIPSKELPPNTELRRAPLLSAAVAIEIAAGARDRARAAATELEQIATRYQSRALVASAAEALGRVFLAEERLAEARGKLETAIHLWNEIGAPHESACARMDYARVLRAEGNEDLASLEEKAARSTLERLRSESSPDAEAAPERRATDEVSCFRLDGETRHIVFAGRSVRLRDRKGLRYLARLLAAPEREFHVLELVGLENQAGAASATPSAVSSSLGDAGELLDAQAKEAYRRRLQEIEADLEEATERQDLGRIAQAKAEREFLVRELSRAVGLGGRDRRASSASERARVSVTRAVRKALAQLREHHEELAEHLEHTLRTGTYCVYRPNPRARLEWRM